MPIVKPGAGGCGMGPKYMTDKAIIVFLKQPVKGRVKTRLAKTLGDDKALEIYIRLLNNIRESVQRVSCDIHLFYDSDAGVPHDPWKRDNYERWIQHGDNIGERMADAFDRIFERDYKKAVLIGADIWDLKPSDLENAFEFLGDNDVVLGPAVDGGYYLIGMKQRAPYLFSLKNWSHAKVYADTLELCSRHDLSAAPIRKLKDIDEQEDLEGTDLV